MKRSLIAIILISLVLILAACAPNALGNDGESTTAAISDNSEESRDDGTLSDKVTDVNESSDTASDNDQSQSENETNAPPIETDDNSRFEENGEWEGPEIGA